MKLQKNTLAALACLLACSMVSAREFRTPIPLLRYWLHTDPLNPHDECSQFYAWGGYYQRSSDSANCNNPCTTPTCSTQKCPLSALIFNQSDFAVNNIFATQDSSPINILFSTILSPRISYTDRGAVFGFVSSHAVRCDVVVGGRVAIPFRSFGMKLKQGPIVNNQIDPVLLNDVLREDVEDPAGNGHPIESYAYRLDFLSQLPASWNGPGFNVKLVDYVNTQFVNNVITISNQDVTNNFATLDLENQNPVTVIRPPVGQAPAQPYAQELNQAQGFTALPSDGILNTTNDRRKFVFNPFDASGQPATYAALGQNLENQQAQLWVVPSYISTSTFTQLVEPALIIKDRVDFLLGLDQDPNVPSNPELAINAFFEGQGINFDSQKRGGLGDIDAQFFTQYWWNDCSFVEGNVALRLPTAGSQMAPGQLLLQSLGNNGHPELMFGVRGYWHDYDWLLLQADMLYSAVLKRSEIVAVPYQGALTKNIGTGIPAHVHWHYFLGHAEASVARNITACDYALLRFGYEGYFKAKDSISLLEGAGCSCVPSPTALNVQNLRTNTNVTCHKLYGEACLRHEFSCWTAGIFASVGGVVGGTNAPQETDWYVGLEFFI